MTGLHPIWSWESERISVIIPFTSSDPARIRIFRWTLEYWRAQLPEAEFIVAGSDATPFHKTKAVNEGCRRSTGDVLVIMDADCFMAGEDIRLCADLIRLARLEGRRLWYIPYRRFYRLTEAISHRLLSSHPRDPLCIPDPPPPDWVEHVHMASSGHHWGALIQVMPREAFFEAGGMDIRFQGWGGEDVSFMHAVDSVWGRHKTLDTSTFHIWHPVIPGKWKYTRQWEGQPTWEMNDALSGRYEAALGDQERMRSLIAESDNLSTGA